MKLFVFILGVVIMFATLWGGMYIGEEVLPDSSWMEFPLVITGFFIFMIGLLLTVYASLEM